MATVPVIIIIIIIIAFVPRSGCREQHQSGKKSKINPDHIIKLQHKLQTNHITITDHIIKLQHKLQTSSKFFGSVVESIFE